MITWFKNLNAARLLLNFSVLIGAIGCISWLGISSLGSANKRLEVLYRSDTMGSINTNKIANARLSIGRQGRDAVLNIDEPAIVAADIKAMDAGFAVIRPVPLPASLPLIPLIPLIHPGRARSEEVRTTR